MKRNKKSKKIRLKKRLRKAKMNRSMGNKIKFKKSG